MKWKTKNSNFDREKYRTDTVYEENQTMVNADNYITRDVRFAVDSSFDWTLKVNTYIRNLPPN